MRLIIALWLAVCAASGAATHTATNLSEADLIWWSTNVADGDTVVFPSGSIEVTRKVVVNASITAAVVWTNAVTLLFSEPAVITNKMSSTPDVENYVFRFAGPTNAISRIAGVTIDGSVTGSGISVGSHQWVRVDHCNFRYIYGRATMFWGYRAYGLVDHCTHLNCRIVHEVDGNEDQSWDDPSGIVPGATNCVVFESNSVVYENANWVAQDIAFYNGQGARVVNRYNSITSNVTGTNVWYWDCHGNQEPVPSGNSRGTIYAVLVGNRVDLAKCPLAGGVRGGQLIMISNVVNVTSGDPTFRLTEEEGWNTAYFSPLLTTWPAADQITNSYFVGNSFNGAEVTTNQIAANFIGSNDATLIQRNRDYWITNGAPPASVYVDLVFPHPRVTAEDTPAGPTATATSATVGTLLISP